MDCGPEATAGRIPAIRVFVVVAVRLYREGIAGIVGRRDDLLLVGSSPDWRADLASLQAARPDVVLLDMGIPGRSEAVASIHRAAEGTRVVALGVTDDDDDVIDCAEAGVSGYVTRDDSPAELVEAVRSVARGEMLCSPHTAATLLRRVSSLAAEGHRHGTARLTRREREIVELIGDGLSNKEIAQRLVIELPTVKNHVHNILEKLGVRRRGDAVARVRARGVAS